MLSKESRLILDFIDECRNHKMMEDELFNKSERMYDLLFKVEAFLKPFQDGNDLFVELEGTIFETINLTKEIYLEYGENINTIKENYFYQKCNKEA